VRDAEWQGDCKVAKLQSRRNALTRRRRTRVLAIRASAPGLRMPPRAPIPHAPRINILRPFARRHRWRPGSVALRAIRSCLTPSALTLRNPHHTDAICAGSTKSRPNSWCRGCRLLRLSRRLRATSRCLQTRAASVSKGLTCMYAAGFDVSISRNRRSARGVGGSARRCA
jgi:hypothetical protein